MTTATVIRGGHGPLEPAHRACFGRLVRAEWTEIRSVRSTVWFLGILVVTAIGVNTFITAGQAWQAGILSAPPPSRATWRIRPVSSPWRSTSLRFPSACSARW